MKRQSTNSIGLAIVLWVALSFLVSACAPAATTAPTETPLPTAIPIPTKTPTAMLALTQTPDPLDLVKAFEDAFNRHDLEATMGLMTVDMLFYWTDWIQTTSREETQALINEYFFGENSTFTHTDCSTAGDTVTCKAIMSNDFTKAAGVNDYHFDQADFTFRENKIRKIFYYKDQVDDNTKINEFASGFFSWLEKNYPSEYGLYVPNHLAPGSGRTLGMRELEYAATLK